MSASAAGSVEIPALAGGSGAAAARPVWSRRVTADLVGMFDVCAVVLGALVPAIIYGHVGGMTYQWTPLVQAALITSTVHYACMLHWGMYDINRMHDFPVAPGRIAGALGLSALAVLGLGLPFAPATVHMWVWYSAWLSASFTLILGGRIIARSALARMTAAGRFDERVAVFGAGAVARRVHDHLKDEATGIHFVGVFDDRAGTDRVDPDGLEIAGKLDDLIEAGRRGEIDRIVIALPQAADRRIATIAAKLEQLPSSLHVVTHIASDVIDSGPAHKVSALGSVGMLDVKTKPLADWAPFVKRAEDYVLGTVFLVLSLPLLVLIALAIRLESKGPVLFRQRRRGLNHRVIEVLKFRTMTVTEDGAEIAQATRNDPRVTRVGWLLRRTSLDELPQLVNVLKGEMSLVGPRPHALVHDEKWGEQLESYSNRHQVKPGITGLAQVEGWRGEAPTTAKIQARVEQDLAYIRNWSLGLDLKILWRTVWAVIRARNAH